MKPIITRTSIRNVASFRTGRMGCRRPVEAVMDASRAAADFASSEKSDC
jgi:hypothetical protein